VVDVHPDSLVTAMAEVAAKGFRFTGDDQSTAESAHLFDQYGDQTRREAGIGRRKKAEQSSFQRAEKVGWSLFVEQAVQLIGNPLSIAGTETLVNQRAEQHLVLGVGQ
jgi:hypothetical protein